MKIEEKVMVPMPDGIKLATDLYFPDGPAGPWPVFLIRTPYDKSLIGVNTEAIVNDGAVFAFQYARGCFDSEGQFAALESERKDGAATVAWLREQSWCNGRIGTGGPSYLGATQWASAIEQAEGMVSAMPQVTSSLFNGFGFYTRGVVQLDTFLLWTSAMADQENQRHGRTFSDEHVKLKVMRETSNEVQALMIESATLDPTSEKAALAGQKLMQGGQDIAEQTQDFLSQPLSEAAAQVAAYAPWLQQWLDAIEDPDADFWRSFDWEQHRDAVNIPMFHHTGWFDLFIRGQLRDFAALSARRDGPFQKLLIAPEDHVGLSLGSAEAAPLGERLLPVEYVLDEYMFSKMPVSTEGQLSRRWTQHWLHDQDTGLLSEAPITLYVQGEDVWRDECEWPLARTEWTPVYLSSGGSANTANGDGQLSFERPGSDGSNPDSFQYDPADPAPTKGGTFLNIGILPGIFEQSSVESREDVLVYTSAALNKDLEVTGPVTMKLWAATSAVDTDFTAKLVDVAPDGQAHNICDGVTRLRFRKDKPGLVTPGEEQEVEIELSPTSYLLRAGHQIRLQVSSSNFPLFDPNPNTGKSLLVDRTNELIVAEQTIYHDADRPSHLILPVIPRS